MPSAPSLCFPAQALQLVPTFSLSITTAATSPKAPKYSLSSSPDVPRAKPLTKRLRCSCARRSARRLRSRRCFLPRRCSVRLGPAQVGGEQRAQPEPGSPHPQHRSLRYSRLAADTWHRRQRNPPRGSASTSGSANGSEPSSGIGSVAGPVPESMAGQEPEEVGSGSAAGPEPASMAGPAPGPGVLPLSSPSGQLPPEAVRPASLPSASARSKCSVPAPGSPGNTTLSSRSGRGSPPASPARSPVPVVGSR